MKDGKPVVTKVKLPFRFKLADGHSGRRSGAPDVARQYEPVMEV